MPTRIVAPSAPHSPTPNSTNGLHSISTSNVSPLSLLSTSWMKASPSTQEYVTSAPGSASPSYTAVARTRPGPTDQFTRSAELNTFFGFNSVAMR